VTLLSLWALAGLVFLAPLIVAHLRREPRSDYDVPSLLLWEDLAQETTPRSRGLRLPRLPILLFLQALALVLLVVALARPAARSRPLAPTRVYVLDDSLWMGARGRLAAAELRIKQLATGLPHGARVLVVLADSTPHVIYRGSAGRLGTVLSAIPQGAAPPSLRQAMSLVAGLLGSPRDRVVLLRAPEDSAPPLRSNAGEFQAVVIGGPVADQGIFSPGARCGIGGADGCEVRAVVSSTTAAPVTDRYTAYANGRALGSGMVRVGARSSTDIAFSAPAEAQINVRLDARDALPVDDQAWISVPGRSGAPPSTSVTLVGTPTDALSVARAFAAVPGITLRLRTPASYRPADARKADLTIADGWLPASGLPPSPAVVVINPPRLPGGRVGGPLADSTPSGEDPTNDLVSGLDLTSLAIGAGSAHAVAPPDYMTPIVWSPDGTLLAAGDDGTRRVAVLSFDPAQSNLPQLASFPILALNLVRWAADWVPPSAPAGEILPIDGTPGATELTLALDGRVVAQTPLRGEVVEVPVARPGVYTVMETGPGIDRRAQVAVSVAGPALAANTGPPTAPIDLTATRVRPTPTHGPVRSPWLLGAAIVVLLLEWAYWRSRAQPLAAVTG
jgi:Ca-activated chloride channel homolog